MITEEQIVEGLLSVSATEPANAERSRESLRADIERGLREDDEFADMCRRLARAFYAMGAADAAGKNAACALLSGPEA